MKTLLFFISMVGVTIQISAQTAYYNQTKIFHENGYSYQCDYDGLFATLYNIEDNQFIYVDQINRHTGKQLTLEEENDLEFEPEKWTFPKCFEIVNKAFSTEQKQTIKDHQMSISIYISSDTGRIIGVEFCIVKHSPYMSIPLSVFRNIETEIKRQIWFTLTDAGKRLNYVYINWMQYPGEQPKPIR